MNKLAIVIPYYKIDFFEETLKSVAQQTDKRFTLYIGNDASPDNPLKLIEKFLDKKDYNYFDYKENLGGENLALQWERILENVTEEWFQILGDDDVISENFVEVFNDNINENDNVIRVNRKTYDENNILIREDMIQEKSISSIDLFVKGLLCETVTSLSEFIFKKSQFEKYKFEKIDLAWGTDVIAFMQFSNFKDIKLLNGTEVYIKVTNKSITGNNTSLKIRKQVAFNDFRRILLENHSKYFPSELIERLIRDYFSSCINLKKYPSINLYKVYLKKGNLKVFFRKFFRKLLTIKKIFLSK